MILTITTTPIELCIYCSGSTMLFNGKKFIPCPLCHGGKYIGEKLQKINANYQELMDEYDDDNLDINDNDLPVLQ